MSSSSLSESPGRSRRLTRKKTLAAALALTAVTGVAGLVQANTAGAATLDKAMFDVSLADANNQQVGWGRAWSQCRGRQPRTKSVNFDHAEFYSDGAGKLIGASQVWLCRDIP